MVFIVRRNFIIAYDFDIGLFLRAFDLVFYIIWFTGAVAGFAAASRRFGAINSFQIGVVATHRQKRFYQVFHGGN